MHKAIACFLLFNFLVLISNAQNVGIGTTSPNPSAQLDVYSTSRGFLPPRMTTAQRNAIASPAAGLQIYNTTTDCLEIFGRGKWYPMYCIPDELVTDIDGNNYPTVKICDQTWMAKNLDVARYRNGDIIPQVSNPNDWASLTTGAWCWYDNDSTTYGPTYGRLYNWYAVNDPRGLAPTGWHVPSDEEWNKLALCLDPLIDTTAFAIQGNIAGGKLKLAGTTYWISPNTEATNSTGFSALPAGFKGHDGGGFGELGTGGYWWTKTGINPGSAIYRDLYFNRGGILRYTYPKTAGFSVRCVKDTPITTLNNGLVAYYPFTGNAGDSSGNGNHGTVNGATLATDSFGNSDKAYSFNSSYILVPPSNSINSIQNGITISVWLYMENGGPNPPRILELRGGYGQGGDAGFVMLSQSTNNISRTFEVNWWKNSINIGVSPTNSLNSNEWHMLTFTGDGNSGIGNFYIDGILSNTNVTSLSPGIDLARDYGNLNLYIGVDPLLQGGNWGGKLDDIRIYNRALTPAEITYLATH